jgi:hypothetical protein
MAVCIFLLVTKPREAKSGLREASHCVMAKLPRINN